MKDYNEFLATKVRAHEQTGFTVDQSAINPMLMNWQGEIVDWALNVGKAAIFADCGMGKTAMQLEWAHHVSLHTSKPVLVVAPLAVSQQTVEEGDKFGRPIKYVREQSAVGSSGLYITNYEMISWFEPAAFGGVVLDESSILKNFTGSTKRLLLSMFEQTRFKLACTATPAPNDHLELGNHAEFLGVMASNEMISRWFVNDTMKAGGYSLKGHAEADFWRWVTTWAVMLSKPSDVGDYSDERFVLPELTLVDEIVGIDHTRAFAEIDKYGQRSLLVTGHTSATSLYGEKRATIETRMNRAAEVVARFPNEPIVVWCNTNPEADMLMSLIPDAVEARGDEKPEAKAAKLTAFTRGEVRVLVTKPKIAAYGLNWQHCHIQVEASVDNSFEMFYQKVRRSYRFGQKNPVTIYRVYAESEASVVSNVRRKVDAHHAMQEAMIGSMKVNGMHVGQGRLTRIEVGQGERAHGRNWEYWRGDSAVTIRNLPNDRVKLWVESPPFKGLYIYSDALEDLGNCADDAEFLAQYRYIVAEQFRSTMPNGIKAEHCKDLPLYANRDGAMGLDDFPGQLIDLHTAEGWEFAGWQTIWKDPVIEMQRTKNAGLLWSEAFCKRAERARQGMADYVLFFSKPTGQKVQGKQEPRQPIPLSVIARCADLWANEGDLVAMTAVHVGDEGKIGLWVIDGVENVDPEHIRMGLMDGRNCVVRVHHAIQMSGLIKDMAAVRMIFHSRVALTDGTFLVVFRKWVDDMPETHVTHDLDPNSHEFAGNEPPVYYEDARDYSIQVWQRYASPVWFDLDGLPRTSPDVWFDISQTRVLNHRVAREEKDEKHICPLQLDVIEKCIDQFTVEGDLVATAFAGIGSEVVTAVEMRRRAWGSELKESYWQLGVRHTIEAERKASSPTLFDIGLDAKPKKRRSKESPTGIQSIA